MRNKKKLTIAITGVGGGVGQSIIKALSSTDFRLIALDGESLGTGLYAVSESYMIPYANAPEYIDALHHLCKKEDCNMLFPGLDAELPLLSKNVKKFEKIGTQVVVSKENVINIADNKFLTYSFLVENGFYVPKTQLLSNFMLDTRGIEYPIVIKLKQGGARSKDVFFCNDEQELQLIISLKKLILEQYIVQEYIEGDEFTCGSITFNKECFGVIIMRRILRDGDTYKCFVVDNDSIEQEIRRLVSVLKPFGPLNVQLRIKNNKPYILELNARCSGTTAARALSGFNEPLMMIKYLVFGKRISYKISKKVILRYWNELVVDEHVISEMKAKRHLRNMDYKKL